MLHTSEASAADPLATLRAALGEVSGKELLTILEDGLAVVSAMIDPEKLDALMAGALEAFLAGTVLVTLGKVWKFATAEVVRLLLAVTARDARLGLSETDTGDLVPKIEALLGRLCGLPEGATRHCCAVKTKGTDVGGCCGARALLGDTVCSSHAASGRGLIAGLLSVIQQFPGEVDRRLQATLTDGAEDGDEGVGVPCSACERLASEAHLCRAYGADTGGPDSVGSLVIRVASADALGPFFQSDGPPVFCSACVALSPQYVALLAAVRELARGKAGPVDITVDAALVLPVSPGLVPKSLHGAAAAGWLAHGLPPTEFFKGLTVANAVIGASPIARAAFAGGNMRRREDHAAGLAAECAGNVGTPEGAAAGNDTQDPDEMRARPPASVEREVLNAGRSPPQVAQPESAVCQRNGCSRRVAMDANGNAFAFCSGASCGSDKEAPQPAAPAETHTAEMVSLTKLVMDLKAQIANPPGASSGPRAGLAFLQTTASVLAGGFPYEAEDFQKDKHGFEPIFGAHEAHPWRHKFSDLLGCKGLFVGDSEKAKAFGKAVMELLVTTPRVDREATAGQFSHSPMAVQDDHHVEVELANGLKVSTGQVKKPQFPRLQTYLRYLELLQQREWRTLNANKGPAVANSNYKVKQSRLIILQVQFFHAIVMRLTVHTTPIVSWPATWLMVTYIFEQFFYGDRWQPYAAVSDLMIVADELEDDSSLKILSGNSARLDVVANVLLRTRARSWKTRSGTSRGPPTARVTRRRRRPRQCRPSAACAASPAAWATTRRTATPARTSSRGPATSARCAGSLTPRTACGRGPARRLRRSRRSSSRRRGATRRSRAPTPTGRRAAPATWPP